MDINEERVKAAVTGYVDHMRRITRSHCLGDTHRITFDLIDGEPDCDSVKMEKL